MREDVRNGDEERSTSPARTTRKGARSGDDHGTSFGRLLGLGAVMGMGMLFIKQFPELQRYLKMRQM